MISDPLIPLCVLANIFLTNILQALQSLCELVACSYDGFVSKMGCGI